MMRHQPNKLATCNTLVQRRAPLAQLIKCRTIERKVAGSNLTRGEVCFLGQDTLSSLLSTG